MLGTTVTKLIKHEEVNLVHICSTHPDFLISMTQEGTLHATKENCINKNFDFQSVLSAKYDRAVVAQIF